MPEDLFASAKRRIARAKKHASDFEAAVDVYIHTRPTEVIEPDYNEGVVRYFIRASPPPLELSDLASDALDSCRSALDQAVYATARAGGATDPRSAYFPVAVSAAELESVIKRRCRDVPAPVVTLLRGFQAYERGNRTIWALNKLRNRSQHAILAETNAGGGIVQVTILDGDDLRSVGGRWDREKHEVCFMTCGLGSKPNYHASFSLGVIFDKPSLFGDQAAQFVVRHIIQEVERIESEIEAVCHRVGLI